MTLIEDKISKLVKYEQRGLVSKCELLNELLLLIANEACGATIYNMVSAQLKSELVDRLKELDRNGFKWQPLVIGEGFSDQEIAVINDRLRLFYQSLDSHPST